MSTQDYCGLRDKHQHPEEWVNVDGVHDYCFYTIRTAAFERDHQDFIEHLKECGLDEEEIRYCCLEVLEVKE